MAFAFLLLSFDGLFLAYYFRQREASAKVIYDSLASNVSELSYVFSKNIHSFEDIPQFQALVDRIESNSDFIDTVMLIDDRDVLLSSDPGKHLLPLHGNLFHNTTEDYYEQLMYQEGLEGRVRFFEDDKAHEINIVLLTDKEELSYYFIDNQRMFFLYFGLLPIGIMIFVWLFIKYLIRIPLERLRQYAYYQSDVPPSFKIKELEAIRSSMKQTFERLEVEKSELYKLARTDSLSGLANRNALKEYMKRLIADSSRQNHEFAFLFLDIDHFKSVNDSLGHNVGDILLQEVASAISKVLRVNDFVARVGGDEFVIVLHDYASLTELTYVIERIQKRIKTPWYITSHVIDITSSIGIAFYPKDGEDMVSLMQYSDIAMYAAKGNGRDQYSFFTDELNAKVLSNITLDKAMREALKNDEYTLYYQPKVDVKSGEIVGVEALVRWISPSLGFIPPNDFIPLAEENGFISELGMWIMERAFSQKLVWQKMGINIEVSINVSVHQLRQEGFENHLEILLERYDLDTSGLDFEITEYLFLGESQRNHEVLDFIRSKGITISLDDFGTGYSSLSSLKSFPIDNLKIDKVFIDDFETSEGGSFLELIVNIGHNLDLKVIAEGVETAESLVFLQSISCDVYQGYFHAKPLTVEDFEAHYLQQMKDKS